MRDDRFDAFERRHIGPRDADITDMLRVVGASSLEALVDEVVPPSKWNEAVKARAHELAKKSDRPAKADGVKFATAKKAAGIVSVILPRLPMCR